MYQDILAETMLPAAHVNHGGDFIFQHDTNPKDRCKLVREWKEEIDIDSLLWPAQSPDMNPIEQIWDILKRSIVKRMPAPTTLDKLRQAIEEE